MDFQFLLVAINAKYIHSNPAIYSLRAYAGEELRRYVGLAEYTINQPMTEILADIYARKPDVIGFSCYIWNWRLVQELLEEIPKVLPEAQIWLGGPEVSYDGDVILSRYPQLSGIMVGEGEATFRELLGYYRMLPASESGDRANVSDCQYKSYNTGLCDDVALPDERSLSEETAFMSSGNGTLQEIPGLCLPTGYTPCRALTDMDSIPFLYDDLKPFENKILYYETSRGCPYRCSYCLSSIEMRVSCGTSELFRKSCSSSWIKRSNR